MKILQKLKKKLKKFGEICNKTLEISKQYNYEKVNNAHPYSFELEMKILFEVLF